MKRETLIEITRKAATGKTYAFHTGSPFEIGGSVRAYPAAWLEPLAVKKHTGRTEGETTWHLVLHLMMLPGTNPGTNSATNPGTNSGAGAENQNENLWNTLEGDALAIATTVASQPEICTLTNISCKPARQSLSAHGELSVTLECDATMWYN